MTRPGIFGWSYPPGCSGPPEDMEFHSPLREEVWAACEDAGMPEEKIMEIDKLIETWEHEREAAAEEAMYGDRDEEAGA